VTVDGMSLERMKHKATKCRGSYDDSWEVRWMPSFFMRLRNVFGCRPGREYHYTIRVAWSQDGHDIERSQSISFAPGDPASIDFYHLDGQRWPLTSSK
jgi:hypothetical protein